MSESLIETLNNNSNNSNNNNFDYNNSVYSVGISRPSKSLINCELYKEFSKINTNLEILNEFSYLNNQSKQKEYFLLREIINIFKLNTLDTDNFSISYDNIIINEISNENNIIGISLDTEKLVDVFEISENINLGQRIKEFIFEIKVNEKWVTIEKGTTIGIKRLIKFKPTIIKELRFTIVDSKDIPLVSELGLYKSSK